MRFTRSPQELEDTIQDPFVAPLVRSAAAQELEAWRNHAPTEATTFLEERGRRHVVSERAAPAARGKVVTVPADGPRRPEHPRSAAAPSRAAIVAELKKWEATDDERAGIARKILPIWGERSEGAARPATATRQEKRDSQQETTKMSTALEILAKLAAGASSTRGEVIDALRAWEKDPAQRALARKMLKALGEKVEEDDGDLDPEQAKAIARAFNVHTENGVRRVNGGRGLELGHMTPEQAQKRLGDLTKASGGGR